MGVVILVEDSKPDAELLKTVIDSLNMNLDVVWLKNGVECLDYFSQGNLVGKRFSNERKILMLIDLNMPRVNGLELLDALSKDESYKKIPKIIYTTSDSSQDIHKAYDKGVVSYIIKPFDLEEVISKVTSLMKYWFEVVSFREINIEREFIK
jgi:CheY-like chemotaxis protein